MRCFTSGIIALVLVTAVGFAQVGQPPAGQVGQPKADHYHRGTHIIGQMVTAQGTAIGKVTDVVVNSDGCLDYVVVGQGEQLVAVPWTVMRVTGQAITVNMTAEKVRTLNFKDKTWPEFHTPAWQQRVRGVYGEKVFERQHGTGKLPGDGKLPPGKK